MKTQVFVIRRAFVLPLGILLVMLLALLALSILNKQPVTKLIILATVIVPVAGLFLSCLSRRVVLTEEEIESKRLMGQTTLKLSEITRLDVSQMKKRLFISIDTHNDFLILTNTYINFEQLLQQLIKIAPEAATENARILSIKPPVKQGDIISAWVAVAVMAFVLYVQLSI